MAPMAADHFRVAPGMPVVVALAVDAPAVGEVVLPDQRDRAAAVDQLVVPVAIVGHHLAVGMAVGNYRGSDPVHRAGMATGRERLNPAMGKRNVFIQMKLCGMNVFLINPGRGLVFDRISRSWESHFDENLSDACSAPFLRLQIIEYNVVCIDVSKMNEMQSEHNSELRRD